MPHARPTQLTRRGLLTAIGAIGFGALATACGSAGSTKSAKGGGWTFTDDRKKKVSLARRPTHIVAYIGSAAALHDFGVVDQVVGVFGPSKLKNGKPDPQAGAVDIDKVTIVGNVYNEFNIEKYAGLNPDLLVTNMYQPPALWFVPDDSKQKILELAPALGITTSSVSLLGVIKRYEQLATSLGADQSAPKVTDAKTRFDRASATLRKAAKAHGRLTVLAASASNDLFYVSDPKVYADLSYFQDLGVDLVKPNHVTGGFFENLSWEKADKYPADVILLDNRTAALQPKNLTSNPTWSRLPAVKAGQVTPWLSEPRFSYAGAAPLIERLAAALQKAKKVA